MSEAAAFSFRAPSRSMGLKLLLVCFMALLMSIPALFVFGLLMDRSHRAERVAAEVGDLMGGQQTFLGPVLAIPNTTPPAAGCSSSRVSRRTTPSRMAASCLAARTW